MTENPFAGRDWATWTAPEIADVAGLPTAYRRAGRGEPLLYLHGVDQTRAWLPVHQELAHHFDVFAPEHPGYGDTPRTADMDRWEDWVLHYAAFLRTVGLDRVHLVGNGLGAWLAANLAVHYPEKVRSLSLVTPMGVRIPETEPVPDFFRPLDPSGRTELFNGRQDRYADQLVQEDAFEDAMRKYAEDTTTALLIWNPRYDIKFDTRLPRMRVPTVVIAAGDDRVVGNAAATRFAELIPGATLCTLDGPGGEPSSHGMVIEQPAEVVDRIVAHVKESA